MLTLAKIPYTDDWRTHTRRVQELEREAARIYRAEMPKVWRDGTGWLTVEPTPGTFNNNPYSMLAAVRFYEHEPRARRGYYVKLQVMPDGELLSV